MKELIDIFRMNEIDPKTRARLLIKMGRLINDEHQSNITEPVVLELVTILDPENKITKDDHYTKAR